MEYYEFLHPSLLPCSLEVLVLSNSQQMVSLVWKKHSSISTVFLDRIRSEVFRECLGVTSISDKLKEGRLRWFGHMKRRQLTEPVRAMETMTGEGRRSRGRPKLTWDERLWQDLVELHLSEDMVQDRSSWRRRIKVKDL
ncbi:uncharacterized protein LOC110944534 [Helianthus annuus]|uniref:uncharacterized protein LOC110944534 n=1 Tax=Helianthus annuus TaxID=4232 RepID=UPI000B905C88|nr:uncharacterized protein LOC110944534 [Helianthus annuus]